jgi:uncharacterized protein (DUF433 family)
LTAKTFHTTSGYTDQVLIRRPVRKAGQDLRDLPAYSIPEAAAFLAMPTRTLSEWFSGPRRAFNPAGDYESCSLLSFKNVAEAYMVHVLKHYYHFSSKHLQQSLRNLRLETRSRHPLFDNDIRIFGESLLLNKPARGHVGRQTINLSQHRQLAIGDITDVFSTRILQDSEGKPIQVFPWRYFADDNVSRPVSIHPDIAAGRLVVTGSRVPVRALLGMKLSGKSPRQIADDYGLELNAVEKALRHIEKPPIQKVA